jgi:hypothetical protein
MSPPCHRTRERISLLQQHQRQRGHRVRQCDILVIRRNSSGFDHPSSTATDRSSSTGQTAAET